MSGQRNHYPSSAKNSRLSCSDFTSTPHNMTECWGPSFYFFFSLYQWWYVVVSVFWQMYSAALSFHVAHLENFVMLQIPLNFCAQYDWAVSIAAGWCPVTKEATEIFHWSMNWKHCMVISLPLGNTSQKHRLPCHKSGEMTAQTQSSRLRSFQTVSWSNGTKWTVNLELHEMGFPRGAAAWNLQ